MPTRESIIRTVNRQLEDYDRRLGTESEEWEYLTTTLYRLLGPPEYNKHGRPFYSRSEKYQYDDASLQSAYEAVTGKNTAAALEQEYIQDLVNMQGIKAVTSENIKRYAKVRNKAFRYYSELYNYLKAAYEEEYGIGSWDNSDLRDEYYRRGASGALPEDTAFWLDDEINELQGGGFLRGIEAALNDLDAFHDIQTMNAARRARWSRKSKKINHSDFGDDLF